MNPAPPVTIARIGAYRRARSCRPEPLGSPSAQLGASGSRQGYIHLNRLPAGGSGMASRTSNGGTADLEHASVLVADDDTTHRRGGRESLEANGFAAAAEAGDAGTAV